MLKRFGTLAVSMMMAVALLLAGCAAASPTATTASDSTALTGKLSISGSTSMLELVQELAAKFMDTHPGVTVDVQGGGSGVGLQNCLDGVSDIGNSSSALKDTDKAKGLVGTDIALDGVAVIVNTKNAVAGLTAEQITKIYKGEITNWKDLGGADHAITVVNREAASGTRDAFTKFFKMSDTVDGKTVEHYTEKALEQNSTGGVTTTVAGDEFAIGYISVGSLVDTVKALQVDGVAASKASVLDNTYKYWRPFVMATKGEPQGLAKAFIDWCIQDPAGIEIVGKKYIPIHEKK